DEVGDFRDVHMGAEHEAQVGEEGLADGGFGADEAPVLPAALEIDELQAQVLGDVPMDEVLGGASLDGVLVHALLPGGALLLEVVRGAVVLVDVGGMPWADAITRAVLHAGAGSATLDFGGQAVVGDGTQMDELGGLDIDAQGGGPWPGGGLLTFGGDADAQGEGVAQVIVPVGGVPATADRGGHHKENGRQ